VVGAEIEHEKTTSGGREPSAHWQRR
jgi:hypothetical protein